MQRLTALLAFLLIPASHCFGLLAPTAAQPHLSTPEECARTCVDGEPPKRCYWKFHVEYYTTIGPACDLNQTDDDTTQNLVSDYRSTECVLADGFEKTIFTINRRLPGPSIQVCKGDYIIVDVDNAAEGLEVTIHWHGVFQQGSQYYDGVPMLTQCPIHSANTFRYQFTANNSGTHFYHSHVSVHMLDGQYGSLIVRDPPSKEVHYDLYDVDDPKHVLHLSDWMHELSLERYPGRYRSNVGQAAQNFLVNGRGRVWADDPNKRTDTPLAVFHVEQGKRYRFRIINGGSTVCLAELTFLDHRCLLIAQDGVPNEPVYVDKIISGPGERMDCVIHANNTPKAYWILVRGLGECAENKVYQLAKLVYDGASEEDASPAPTYDTPMPTGSVYDQPFTWDCAGKTSSNNICIKQLKNAEKVPYRAVRKKADYRVTLPFSFFGSAEKIFAPKSHDTYFIVIGPTILASTVNNISFENLPSPPLSQGYHPERKNCSKDCYSFNVMHVALHSTVDILLYDVENFEGLAHPFHLHGYTFFVMDTGRFKNGSNLAEGTKKVWKMHERKLQKGEYDRPCAKDTIVVPQGGYVLLRFLADNPGWWLFHCHFSWHTATGMNIVFHVGEQDDLPPVPPGFPQCYNWTPDIN